MELLIFVAFLAAAAGFVWWQKKRKAERRAAREAERKATAPAAHPAPAEPNEPPHA